MPSIVFLSWQCPGQHVWARIILSCNNHATLASQTELSHSNKQIRRSTNHLAKVGHCGGEGVKMCQVKPKSSCSTVLLEKVGTVVQLLCHGPTEAGLLLSASFPNSKQNLPKNLPALEKRIRPTSKTNKVISGGWPSILGAWSFISLSCDVTSQCCLTLLAGWIMQSITDTIELTVTSSFPRENSSMPTLALGVQTCDTII